MKKKINPVLEELLSAKDPVKEAFFPRFFKTGKGEYGYGDKFIGVTVPIQRKIALRHYIDMDLKEIHVLLHSDFHEARLTGLLVLVLKFEKLAKSEKEKSDIVSFYKSNLSRINNWDLVDTSAEKILGPHYFGKNTKYLHDLTKTKNLWENRIGIMSTFHFIKKGEFADTLIMCELFLDHKQDLIHKASGWMLREIGKRDKKQLILFLTKHVSKMPRTMLRYSIEKLPEKERLNWLSQED
ncbi:DNA alkylation repair protein [Leptospira ilyithenensis]|uniref:DNA alkylation repair protein n=1 Tax=Leptospira ilyithenensis TaxID=2484901 RepID=A0A4R9LSL4_9LEPT|nr:DNA alkylation repair protein [Leptospira ilyithenensis]TGN14395.1 DNA alkylation repair protein [Leptospira ilyithenensis]